MWHIFNGHYDALFQDAKLSSSVELLQSNALGPDVCVQQGGPFEPVYLLPNLYF